MFCRDRSVHDGDVRWPGDLGVTMLATADRSALHGQGIHIVRIKTVGPLPLRRTPTTPYLPTPVVPFVNRLGAILRQRARSFCSGKKFGMSVEVLCKVRTDWPYPAEPGLDQVARRRNFAAPKREDSKNRCA